MTFNAPVCNDTQSSQVTFGIITIFVSTTALVLCYIPEENRKRVLNFFRILIGIFGLLLGLAQATHIFDASGYFSN
ncbi:MAG: hypothetical protein A2W93_04410 [Bacteroidetes bacterium GWF2_43_63]|nr:MAG: hypothetical protein A2W94_12400 [Bacteroidetes bacterium GWE2_42_42]OFY56006.1 MAG: hypothetical protein A2W93_04410 [Bacteroidetes bacterium GWF2_43_63]HBG70752.1 hypothetical protein [Bacteroidales bacterium]HCB62420.1 hypothetical protein [Bacteroidales bacterium]HCY21875.1 hypothetical protein [Bacteroidales bacterium]